MDGHRKGPGRGNMRLSEAQQVRDLTLEEIVGELTRARESLESQQATVYYLERSLVEGMEERGATVVRTDEGEAKLTTPVTYDYGILAGLREITSPDDLVGYTPEHEEVRQVPEKWNLTQAKTLSHLSHQHREIIEDAKIYGRAKIQFKPKRGGR
jgi:hypothetical protein